EVVLDGKMLEMIRVAPEEMLDRGPPPGDVVAAALLDANGRTPLRLRYREDCETALVVGLPYDVAPGRTVTVELDYEMRLPAKQGRWGGWKGVTCLTHWLPVLAYRDGSGWRPVPFVPWYQPCFNEAGIYTARVRLPTGQQLASTAAAVRTSAAGPGWRDVELA